MQAGDMQAYGLHHRSDIPDVSRTVQHTARTDVAFIEWRLRGGAMLKTTIGNLGLGRFARRCNSHVSNRASSNSGDITRSQDLNTKVSQSTTGFV
jgi:hypothetical protein